jgi:hypothetical protein
MEGRQKITFYGNVKIGQTEIRGNPSGFNVHYVIREKGIGRVANCREKSKGQRRNADAGICNKPPHYASTAITEMADRNLVTKGWVNEKPCLVTTTPERLSVWQGRTSPPDGPNESRAQVSRCKRYLGKPFIASKLF